uniref:Ig-like domain-containing protein n=1 Tax=Strongyloides stercoralis TaxID=6248 RepID=A0AAF5I3S6_STRER
LRKTSKKYLVIKPYFNNKTINFKLRKTEKTQKLLQHNVNISSETTSEITTKSEISIENKIFESEKSSSSLSNIKSTTNSLKSTSTNKKQDEVNYEPFNNKEKFIEKEKFCKNKVSKDFVLRNENINNEKIDKTYKIYKCYEKITKMLPSMSRISKQSIKQNISLLDKPSTKEKHLLKNKVKDLNKVDMNVNTSKILEVSNTSVRQIHNNITKKYQIKNKSCEIVKKSKNNKPIEIKDNNDLTDSIKVNDYDINNELARNVALSVGMKDLTKTSKNNKSLSSNEKEIDNINLTKPVKSLIGKMKKTNINLNDEKLTQNKEVKPNFIIKNQEYKLQLGSKIIIKQQLIANPEPNIEIKINDQNLETNENVKILIEKENKKFDIHLNGIFLFTASNVLGNDKSTVKVKVKTNKNDNLSKLEIPYFDNTEEKYVKEGEKLELFYIIKTYDLVEIQMFKDNLPYTYSNFNIEKKDNKYVASIKFNKIALSDGGEYICRTITKNGQTNIKTVIYVEKIDIQQQSQLILNDKVQKRKKSIPKALKIPYKINSLYGEPSTKVSTVEITANIEKKINFENSVHICLNQTRSLSSTIKLKIPKLL